MQDKWSKTKPHTEKNQTSATSVEEDWVSRAAPAEDSESNEKFRLRDIILPSGLHDRYIKGFIGAFIVALLSTVLLVMYKTPQCCIGYIVAGALVYLSISIKLDFASGEITELSVICTSVSFRIGSKSVKVGFRTNDDVPRYYSFIVPGKADQFNENHVYAIYFREKDPQKLLAYIEL